MEAVKIEPYSLKYADESLKKDKEFAIEAVKNNGDSVKYVDENLLLKL